MNRKVKFVLFSLGLCFSFSATKAQDYSSYYRAINQAENQIFVQNEFEEGLRTYLTAFQKYDFVFLSDCVTALQIALYAENEKFFIKICRNGMQNGLIPRNLDGLSYVKNHPIYIKTRDSVAELYRRYHPKYLSRIDTATLQKIIFLYANDQKIKNGIPGESDNVSRRQYRAAISKTMNELRAIISEKGFPTEKIIGVGQIDIMKDLKTGKKDLKDYFFSFDQIYLVNKDQFLLDERSFSSTLLPPMIHHYESSYGAYRLYPDSFYIQQILAGNLHPKDFAYIHDIVYRINRRKKPDIKNGEKFFGGGWMDKEYLIIPDSQINSFRKPFFLPPIENDRAKYQFMKEKVS